MHTNSDVLLLLFMKPIPTHDACYTLGPKCFHPKLWYMERMEQQGEKVRDAERPPGDPG